MLDNLLPGDYEAIGGKQIFEPVDPSPMLQNCVLTIVNAEPNDSQETIRDASVIGFVYVSEVDDKKRKIRLLAPLSGRLPRKAMILGSWPEAIGDLMG
jgi:polyribonucleotide 5'-hydroxyl-kinase